MPYFTHSFGGVPLDLAHLEPRTVAFFVQKVGRELAIDVRFSNHTFTVAFRDGIHSEGALIWDHNRRRAYDPERHALSHGLPVMIDALPTAAVHLTRSDRNYAYFAAAMTEAGQHYPMFFGLRRAPAGDAHQLKLTVESAYPVADRRAVLEGSTKVSFPVLCAKVFRGERVQPQARR